MRFKFGYKLQFLNLQVTYIGRSWTASWRLSFERIRYVSHITFVRTTIDFQSKRTHLSGLWVCLNSVPAQFNNNVWCITTFFSHCIATNNKERPTGIYCALNHKLHILSFWSHLRSQANTYLGGEIQGKNHSIQLTMLQQAVGYVGWKNLTYSSNGGNCCNYSWAHSFQTSHC